MCFKRQFVRKMWPIQLTFLLFILCRIILSYFTLYFFTSDTIGPTHLIHASPAPHSKTFHVILICFTKCPSFITIHNYAPNVALRCFFLLYCLPLNTFFKFHQIKPFFAFALGYIGSLHDFAIRCFCWCVSLVHRLLNLEYFRLKMSGIYLKIMT
jgi:hypothetical protein